METNPEELRKPLLDDVGEAIPLSEVPFTYWHIVTDLGRFALYGEEVLGKEF